MRNFAAFALIAGQMAWGADLITPPTPVFFDKPDPVVLPDEPIPPTSSSPSPIASENLEEHISQAVLERNWKSLPTLIEQYKKTNNFDPILVEYAQGAWQRSNGQQKNAIKSYQNILSKNPDLPYVKLDLALMLFEDKAYQDAKNLLLALKSEQLSPQTHAIIDQVLQTIKARQSLQFGTSFNYEANNNINNASSERTITWLGKQWQKDPDSLPQKAHGVRYQANAEQERNLGGNHFLLTEGNLSGAYYWDNPKYNEQSLEFSLGYKYADKQKSASLVPYVEQNWLNGKRYNQSLGLTGRVFYGLSPRNKLQLFGGLSQKRYHDDKVAKRYNSTLVNLGTTLSHQFDTALVYGGVDVNQDNTLDKELSSTRLGVRLGVRRQFGQFGTNASVRYAKRDFKAPATFVYPFVRHDKETGVNLALWHNKIAYKGFRPQLNIRYLNIDSNMPAFYSRNALNYFVSLEREF